MPPADPDADLLNRLQSETFSYFTHEVDPVTGLVADKTKPDGPASIAATGLALTAYPVGVERGLIDRTEAVDRTLLTLRFFRDSPQGVETHATGYKGFYYHFLEMDTGARVWNCELSTIDSTLLVAGALAAARYFDRKTATESEVRSIADQLYRRMDWQWALDGGVTVTHGWTPEHGFLPYRWRGYDEALLLYVLGLGSPTSPLPEESYHEWIATYTWKTFFGRDLVYAGPLFIHQLSHIWIDFHGIQDDYMRAHKLDYFENSRRATYVQREYAIRNPFEYSMYGPTCWGLTASDGPGPSTLKINGVERQFFDYVARGAPLGPDDGTIAPWSVVASLPFAPEIVLPTIRYFVDHIKLTHPHEYGFKATFNPTYPEKSGNEFAWVSPWTYGLNQGPIALMIENYRTQLIWNLMRTCDPIVAGLRRAGFSGGWLDG
jgi:hypothetical protein